MAAEIVELKTKMAEEIVQIKADQKRELNKQLKLVSHLGIKSYAQNDEFVILTLNGIPPIIKSAMTSTGGIS